MINFSKSLSSALICAMIFFFACTSDTNQVKVYEPTKTTIAGQISDALPTSKSVSLVTATNQYMAPVMQDKFTLSFNATEPDYYTMGYGRNNVDLYITPGDDLDISFSGRSFLPSLIIKGKGSEIQKYLLEKAAIAKQLNTTQSEIFKAAPEDVDDKLISFRKQMEDLLDQHRKSGSFTGYFIDLEKASFDYLLADTRMTYPQIHKYYDAQYDGGGESYFDFLNEMDLDKAEHLKLSSFRSLIADVVAVRSEEIMNSDDSFQLKEAGYSIARFQAIKEKFKNNQIQGDLMFSALKDQIRYFGINGIESLVAEFNNISKNDLQKKDINGLVAQWQPLAKGKPAPDFKYVDMDGTEVALSDLKGKYVYIDVWATWCGPCKRELPFLEKLQETYDSSDDIVFASVSIDQNKDAWRKMVTDKNMKGIQLIADRDWKSSITQDYKITGIPRFLLIDPNGNIVNVHAPRPSSPQLEPLLASLVKS